MSSALGRGLGSLIPSGVPTRKTADAPGVTDGERILKISTAQIAANPHQPRGSFDHASLEDLVNSVREHGILQPLVVVKVDSGYQLIAGERRLRAARIAGLKQVPAIVREADRQEQLELAIVENVQRKDLNPIDRARAYWRLIDEFGLTQDQVARRVGKSRVTVANNLRLLDLPDEIQQALSEEKITEGHAKAIASVPTTDAQLKMFHAIVQQGLSVRSGERLAKGAGSKSRARRSMDPEQLALEEELQAVFGTRVRIDKHGKAGTIRIEFYSDEEFRTIIRRLSRS